MARLRFYASSVEATTAAGGQPPLGLQELLGSACLQISTTAGLPYADAQAAQAGAAAAALDRRFEWLSHHDHSGVPPAPGTLLPAAPCGRPLAPLMERFEAYALDAEGFAAAGRRPPQGLLWLLARCARELPAAAALPFSGAQAAAAAAAAAALDHAHAWFSQQSVLLAGALPPPPPPATGALAPLVCRLRRYVGVMEAAHTVGQAVPFVAWLHSQCAWHLAGTSSLPRSAHASHAAAAAASLDTCEAMYAHQQQLQH